MKKLNHSPILALAALLATMLLCALWNGEALLPGVAVLAGVVLFTATASGCITAMEHR